MHPGSGMRSISVTTTAEINRSNHVCFHQLLWFCPKKVQPSLCRKFWPGMTLRPRLSLLIPSTPHRLRYIFKHKTSREPQPNSPCVLLVRWPSPTHIWRVNAPHMSSVGDICWAHRKPTAVQAFPLYWARVFFMIMILSSVHKHTSPKCFPSCAWSSFHLRLICFLPL